MSSDNIPSNPLPLWLKALIIVLCLPILGYPLLLAGAPDDATVKHLLYFYPVFVLLSAWCEWRSWAHSPEITWVLIVLSILSHISMYMLCL